MYSITITITCNHTNQRLQITFRLLKTCNRLHVIMITDYNYNRSDGSVSTTLHDGLGIHKLTARWVPKSLRKKQMATIASVYSALLKRFRSKEDDFLSRLVTVDVTWVRYYEPENKAQSRQSVGPGSPRPKKFKTHPLLAR